jgi:hypothetical protein
LKSLSLFVHSVIAFVPSRLGQQMVPKVLSTGPCPQFARCRSDVLIFDNMESGSLVNLKKAGPGSFNFEVQDNKIYGYQGTLMVWFYGMCDLRNVKVEAGDKLKMALRWPVGLTHVRPVYSYDSINWNFVPEGWGRDETFRFDLPCGHDLGFTATHFPIHLNGFWRGNPAGEESNKQSKLSVEVSG